MFNKIHCQYKVEEKVCKNEKSDLKKYNNYEQELEEVMEMEDKGATV